MEEGRLEGWEIGVEPGLFLLGRRIITENCSLQGIGECLFTGAVEGDSKYLNKKDD